MPAVNLLARGYRLEVSADGSTNWLKIGGLNDLNDQITPNKVDSSNYDSDGWASSEITMQSWSVTAKYNRQATSGVVDPAADLIRSTRGKFGDAARLYARWYSTTLTSEPAWQGRAIVELNKSKTGVADLNEFTVTLTGDGALTSIANPYSPSSAPVITAATPSGVAAGGQVQLTGLYFTGTVATTGVKIDGINASSWLVQGDTSIVAVMPSALLAPTGVTTSTATTGGTYAAGTYYFKVVAVNSAGESLTSAEVSQATTGSTSTITVNWSAVTGAASYKVYQGTAAGSESVYFTSSTTSVTLTGSAGTAGTPLAKAGVVVTNATGSSAAFAYTRGA